MGISAVATPLSAQARLAGEASNAAAAQGAPATCIVHSLPSFIAQGELGQAAMVADIVEVECNPETYGTGSKIKVDAAQLYSRCAGHLTWYVTNPFREEAGRGISLELDADGNATVALRAGPDCQAGDSLITAHMEEEPFESFTTSFSVLAPQSTPPGVYALPENQVEDAYSSSVATIIETEFRTGSEKKVRIGSEELYARCRFAPHIHWIEMNGADIAGVPEVTGVELDDDGNAFVIAIGDQSCAEGPSLVEADLEDKPFTTFTTNFTVQSPQPTVEPSFTIEKRQAMVGSGGGFTTSPLKGALGQTVDYEITVTNMAGVPETFSEFTDAHCDPGTIAGGPGASPVAPGQSTSYTCDHVLGTTGSYVNEATVTGNSAGGIPLKQTSNQVVVEVATPAFTIEKLQQIVGSDGGFTTAQLTGTIGQTVDYQIVVKNTGNEPLAFSGFTDARCDAGTLAGGPGEAPVAPGSSTTYTCDHVLSSIGSYVNEASVTGTPEGEPPITHTSNPVEAVVLGPEVVFTLEKRQEIAGSGTGLTASPLTGAIGETVAYEIVATNTGKEAVVFSNFSDVHCDAGTLAGGSGEMPVAPGSSTTYTCSHVLTSAGSYVNEASLTGTGAGEPALIRNSNQVVVSVPEPLTPAPAITKPPAPPSPRHEVLPTCEERPPALHGASGPKRGAFTVQVGSSNVKQITFYLDGRKLKTLKQSQAKDGKFTIKIDARKLSYGAHKVSIKAIMASTACASVARSGVFVHPFTESVTPRFTG